MLLMNDFHVVEAENGLEGVEVAQRQLPDLILCDVHMPELDGFGALARLRNTASTAAIPFIFLTGLSEKPLMRQGMELGADDYLTKPFTLQELIGAVRTRLDKKAVLAQQAEKKLEELRGNISMALPHELLTPIAGILGFSSILLEDCASMRREEVQEAASNIHQAAVRLRRTIENFLLYSQIELVAADPSRVAAVREGRHSHRAECMAQWAGLGPSGWPGSGSAITAGGRGAARFSREIGKASL
jgi:CheY-like chemotaxis protein